MELVIPVFILCLFIFIINLYRDKLSFLSIKINMVEEKINGVLIKRRELLKESEIVIKQIINTNKQVYEGIETLSTANISMIELDRKLLVYVNEFYLIKDKYKKLQKSEEFQKITFAINETVDLLNAYKEYYNDNAQKYNKLIKSFPVIIVSFFKRTKSLLFFDKKSIDDNDYASFKY